MVPMLGEVTAFTIATTDLEASLAYYRLLGFSETLRMDWPFPWIQISDGVVLIMLRKDVDPYFALTYYGKDVAATAAELEQRGIVFTRKPGKKDMLKRYIFQSPDGLTISMVSMVEGFRQPPGPRMLDMPQKDYFNPGTYVNKACGLFGELAHPVAALDSSLKFWELLGYKQVSRFESPYPWAIVSDGLAVVGLHQAGHFGYPAMTWFAADMDDKLRKLKAAGLSNYAEQSPGNAVLTTPEQQHIFLYSLGVPSGATSKKPELSLPTIETDRLLLKELNPDTLGMLLNTRSDEEIMNVLGLSTADELATEKDNFRRGMTTFRTSFKHFAIVEKASGRTIGRCGFHTWYLPHSRAELGYHITSEQDRGKGYMTEAAKAIIRHGFETMGLNRIEALTSPSNVPSISMLKSLGFTEEGRLRSHYFKNGVMEDSLCFALLRSEYS